MILGIRLIVPAGLMIHVILFSTIGYERNSLRELAFLACGLPILLMKFFLWVFPREMKYLLLGRQ